MSDEDSPDVGRSIEIKRDAIGNTIISGDGNVVVVQSTRLQAAEESAPPRAADIGSNPYMGLLAFLEEDADRFFGREEQTARLWERLRDLHAHVSGERPTRLLPVLGPSGSGKSSLARAGLIAELARRPMPGMRRARVGVMTPGAYPVEALAAVLARIATDDPTPVAKTTEFEAALKRPNDDGEYDGLRRIADALPDIAAAPLIVLVDQFEEIYSLCSDRTERTLFIDNLLLAARDAGGHLSVVITLRTDFVGETQTHEALNALICEHQVMIPAMNEEELRQAIAKPAEEAGHPLDEATITLLLNDTRDRDGALPLLQFALTRIWDGLANGIEPAVTYRAIGGVGGALAGEAQRIYQSLNDQEKRIAKRVFLGLVQLGEGTRDTRRRAKVKSLISVTDDPTHVEGVIHQFSAPEVRLITLSADERGDADSAEVTHEALFAHWRQLSNWVEDSRDDVRFQRRLDDVAVNWNDHGRPEGALWRPPDLDLLTQFQERATEDMTPLQMDFFNASKAAERQRLETAQRAEHRLRRRTLIATSAAITAFVLLGISIVLSFIARTAHQQEREAQARVEASLDASRTSTIVIDKEGQCLYVNDALVGMFEGDLNKKALEDQNVFTLSSWKDTGMESGAREAFDTWEKQEMEIPPGSTTTTARPFSADVEFIPYKGGDKRYLLVTLNDNTTRKMLEFLSWILTGTEQPQDPLQDPRNAPTIYPRGNMKLREILDEAAEAVGTDFVSRPVMEADIRSVLGRAYSNLGLFDEAKAQFESALKTRTELAKGDDQMVATSMHDLGEVHFALADYVKAEEYFRQALTMRRELLGDSDVDIASVMHDLAKVLLWANQCELAKENFEAALEMRINLLGPEDLAVAESLHEMVRVDWGDPSIVEPRLERALEIRREKLGDDHLLVADTLITLAESLTHLHGYRTGRYSEAEARLRQAVEIHRKALSENHPRLAAALFMLGEVLAYQRKYPSAESALTEALEIRRVAFSDQHPLVAWTLDSLMWLHFEQNKNADAKRYYEEAMGIWRARDQDRHTVVEAHSSLRNLAPLMQARGDIEWAERIYRNDLKLQRDKGGDSPVVAQCLLDLAGFLQETKDDYEGAESLIRQALAILKLQGPQLEQARAHYRLAVLLQDKGDYDESEKELHAAEKILQQDFSPNTTWGADLRRAMQTSRVLLADARDDDDPAGPSAEEVASRWSGWRPSNAWPMSHWPERQSLLRLAALMEDRDNFDAAEELYTTALDAWADRQHPGRVTAHKNLANLFVLKGDDEAAEEQWRLALNLQREVLRPGHGALGETLLDLGALLLEQERFKEAKQQLLESHAILDAAFGSADERTITARDALISLEGLRK